MSDDDFLLDEEDDPSDDFIVPSDESEDDEESDGGDDEIVSPNVQTKPSDFSGKLTQKEIELSASYTMIKESDRKNQDKASFGGGSAYPGNVIDAVRLILAADPRNTAEKAISDYMKEIFHLQSHNRFPASVYTPDRPLRSDDLGDSYGNTEDGGFNAEYAEEAKELVADFISYLANRDLSKDSAVAKKVKKRQLPAFIIFLFSSGMYDLIINCPTMPPEYDKQIKAAFKRIQQQKYDVVEELAQKYEAAGRQAVADRVRKMGLRWFNNEPAEITIRKELADLDLDYKDVEIYRSVRSKFMNASKSITQDLASDMIEVVMDEKKGIYEKLKDKTRSDAIANVKQIYRDWCKENGGKDSELAERIIWKR